MPVHQKKDGRWFVVYYHAGKRVWEAFGRGEQAGASARARDCEIQAAKLRGQMGAVAGSTMTYKELAQMWINARARELSRPRG